LSGFKLTIIGAGSIAWSSRLIRDLCLTKLNSVSVTLMDTDQRRLSLTYRFATRYASELKSNLKFEKTQDRREAIANADVVLNTAMVGGHQYYEAMRNVCEKHGYYRGINSTEWNMVSDYHTIWGYHQLKLMLEVAKDTEELSSNAWLIQVANPVLENTTLIHRSTKVKVVGMCDGYLNYYAVPKILGLDPNRTKSKCVGLNHDIWLTQFSSDDIDAYPLLDEWVNKESEKYLQRWRLEQTNPFDIRFSPAALDMYKRFGVFPIGDTVRNGTWKYHWSLEEKKRWFGPTGGPDSEIGWNSRLEHQRQIVDSLEKAVRDESTVLTEVVPPWTGDDPVVPLVASLLGLDSGSVHQVNIANQGALAGVPDDVAVEVPAKVDSKGVHRLGVDRLPDPVMKYAILPRLIRVEWALHAFSEGGYDSLFDWIITDPRTNSNRQVDDVITALLSIPENEALAKHFK